MKEESTFKQKILLAMDVVFMSVIVLIVIVAHIFG